VTLLHLENAHVRFTFDRATGSLADITDLTNGQEHLLGRAGARLFRVACPSGLWMSRYADSHEADPPEFIPETGKLTIRWPRLKPMDGEVDIAVTVRVELPADEQEARFTAELTNNGSDRLHEFWFPWAGGWTGLAGPESDCGLCGCTRVDLRPRERETFAYNLMGSHRRTLYEYPLMQLPFLDISGGGRGLSYICYQERPYLGGIVIANLDPEPDGQLLSFAWVHFPFTKPGQTWSSPPVGISVHRGDWHATADRYRRWLEPRWKPPHPPPRLSQSIGYQVIQLRNFDGQPNHRFQDIPRLAADGLKYGVADLCVWDPITCLYLRPDEGDFWDEFDPSQSLDDLRAGVAEAKRLGANVSTMVNYRLVRMNSQLFRALGGGAQVVRSLYGSPVIEDWSTCSSGHAGFRTPYLARQAAVLCQKSASFRRRAIEVTRKTLDLGFTSLFIDQAFETKPCFAEGHGHDSPADTHAAALEWFEEAVEMVRKRDPDAYVIGETTDVFGSQYLDLAWNWAWASLAPEVMRYTIPETLHCWVVDHQPKALNRAFAMGFLAAFTTGMAEKSLAAYPEFGERVARLAALKKRCAEWIASGRFRDRIGIEATGATAYAYQTADCLAVALADCDGRDGYAVIALDPAGHGRKVNGPGTLYRLDGSASPAGIPLADGRIHLSAPLGAYEAAVWVLPCQPVG